MWTEKELYEELNYVDHTREKRLFYANIVLNDLSLLEPLLNVLFLVNDKNSYRAAWVLEYVFQKRLELIIPYLEEFTKNLHLIHFDSSVRPLAKICESVIKAYYSKKSNNIQISLTENHKKRITETCFDWLINDEKIAPKAFAMNTLYLLGQDFTWIHSELKSILERDYQKQSAGFKARARQILRKLNN